MYKSPRKQDKYERLINMIKGYEHTKEEVKLLAKIKADTVFEITIKEKRCQHNKKYKFPYTLDKDELEDDQIEELIGRKDGKDLVYNLNSQNKAIGSYRIQAVAKSHKREKILTEPSEKQKARSMSRKINRVLIGRMENQILQPKGRLLQTYRIPTQSTLSSQKHTSRKPSTPTKNRCGSNTHRVLSDKTKTQQSSPSKKLALSKQFQTLTIKKFASRLHTQKSKQKKTKIQSLVSSELKKHQQHLIQSSSSFVKFKNLLYKKNY